MMNQDFPMLSGPTRSHREERLTLVTGPGGRSRVEKTPWGGCHKRSRGDTVAWFSDYGKVDDGGLAAVSPVTEQRRRGPELADVRRDSAGRRAKISRGRRPHP